jgi:proton-translocating NAD(P)+ transhydrogenase subunit alpha
MIVGVLKETLPENRVSILPEHLSLFKKMHLTVQVEEDAGVRSFASNHRYERAGAKVVMRETVLKESDVVLTINLPDMVEIEKLRSKVLMGVYHPLFKNFPTEVLTNSDVTVFSLDMIPRTTRAQSMDVLSSQANIAGYKAILMAANILPHYFPMFMTAAGNIAPAKILILGAGVAGLQAVATARRLGGVVEVFDTRPAVKEEVNSLGAKFIEVEGAADASQAGGYAVVQSEEFQQKQKARIAESVAKSDIVVTTAQIPGKKAPVLITRQMIQSMKEGSVIVDLAAETGGNTELTKNGEIIVFKEVTIIGNSNLPSTMPYDASKLYGKNIINFLQLLTDEQGNLKLDFEDDLVKGTCITHGGKIINKRIIANRLS